MGNLSNADGSSLIITTNTTVQSAVYGPRYKSDLIITYSNTPRDRIYEKYIRHLLGLSEYRVIAHVLLGDCPAAIFNSVVLSCIDACVPMDNVLASCCISTGNLSGVFTGDKQGIVGYLVNGSYSRRALKEMKQTAHLEIMSILSQMTQCIKTRSQHLAFKSLQAIE